MADSRARDKGFSRRPRILEYIGAGDLSEGEAQAFAHEVVRQARSESFHTPEAPAPEREDVRQRREAHHHSEG